MNKYNDINSINPKYWGKSGWIFLNSIALTYKPENKEKYKLFFSQLPFLLPCSTCGANLINNMHTLDDALTNKSTLLNWLLEVRNNVQIENGRPLRTFEFNMNEIFNDCNSYNSIYILCAIITIVIILTILYKK